MAKCGYTGSTCQYIPEAGCLFVWSPEPYIVPLPNYDKALDSIFKLATKKKSRWYYWYDYMDWEERLR